MHANPKTNLLTLNISSCRFRACLGALLLLAGMAQAAEPGYWKQQGEVVYLNKQLPPYNLKPSISGYYAQTTEIGTGRLRVTITNPTTGFFTITEAAWTLPGVMVPGQVVPVSWRCQVLKSQPEGYAAGGIVCYVGPEPVAGGILDLFQGIDVNFGNGKTGYSRERINTKNSVTGGSKGSKYYLTLCLSGGLQVATPYVWVEGAPPAQPPATPLPPMVVVTDGKIPPFTPTASDTPGVIYTNQNKDVTTGGPSSPTTFTLTESTRITSISTNHGNGEKGVSAPGTIGLKGEDGTVYGPWPATGKPADAGGSNAIWTAAPNVTLKPGKYTVIDSDPTTWSTNKSSSNAGFVEIKGAAPAAGATATQPVAPSGTAPAEPATVSRMTLQAAKRKAKTGETVTVPVWLLKGAGLIDMNFNLEYDPAVVQVVGSIVKGNLLDGADFEANPGKPGVIQIGLVPKSGGVATSDGTLAQIPFKVVGPVGSKTPLHLVPRKASLTGGAVASPATLDGEIQIVGDADLVPGDINGDGRVGMDDVLMALKISVGLLPFNTRADMDKDEQVTAADARVIRDRVLGIKG